MNSNSIARNSLPLKNHRYHNHRNKMRVNQSINHTIAQLSLVWITVADEENGNHVTNQVKLNEDGELPVEEIVKVFPGDD